MCSYLDYKLALEKTYCKPACASIRQGWKVEVPLVIAGAIVAGAMGWPNVIETGIRGLIGGGAVLFLIVIFHVFRYSFAAPYRLWKSQQDQIGLLQNQLEAAKPRVSFSVGNADKYILGRSYFMFKIRNNGADSDNCLARLSRVIENSETHEYNRVLPTQGQWEQERRGAFNLRNGEPKYVMLIGHFPDGWHFLFEKGMSEAFQLDQPVLAEVAVYGCGPESSASILIELLDNESKTLRLKLRE